MSIMSSYQSPGTLNDPANMSAVSINLFASTPFKIPTAKKSRAKKKTFVRPICDVCGICGQEYRCHRSYVNHMRKHSIKDASSRYPSTTAIMDHCMNTFPETLHKMRLLPAFGAIGKQYEEVIDNLKIISEVPNCPLKTPQWKEFLQLIHEGITADIGEFKVLLPSSLVGVLIKNCDSVLTNTELRLKLCALLQGCVDANSDVCNCFIADYVLMLISNFFKFYALCLKNEIVNVSDKSDVAVQLDFEDLETIHYICGSVVRGFYRKSEKFPHNVGWDNIRKLILNNFLESESVPGPPDSVRGWTIARNRGRLFFVSGKLFDFFTGVAQVLRKTTHQKSRVDSSQVIESVCKGSVVLLWDEAVGSDYLSENASYDLMCGMTKSFCNTYGGGHLKKLLNEVRKNKAEASLALRARVAPRK